ncbi:MAG: tRNA (adenosine(37)-N6)-dimethylallyltransferase MiaA [Pyrinomonadaceae bacterium]
MNDNQKIYAIAGPTASGKTELAVSLALQIGNAEIVNFDSVQIYKGIEIATAKPTAEEMSGVPHHLIDYVDPAINYTAQEWSKDAANCIREIEGRGKTPILVGGTGFYLRTLRTPLFESPKTSTEIRERLTQRRSMKGPESLHRILKRLDPKAAARLEPRDYPRVQRALEVFIQTGERISDLQKRRLPPPEFAARIAVFALAPPRDELYRIIDERTKRHFDAGLVNEVIQLRNAGLSDSTNALGSHGYRRVCEYLRGEKNLDEALEKTKQDVRNYAKRQLSWFRNEKGVIHIPYFGNDGNALSAVLNSS